MCIRDSLISTLGSISSSPHTTEYLPICFEATRVPSISIYNYLARLHSYTECSDSCYILAFIYIDRVLQKNPSFSLNSKNVHRLILASMVAAIKYLDDTYLTNALYAFLGGISGAELNRLEAALLSLLRFDLYVSPQTFYQYAQEIAFTCAKLGDGRGEAESKMKPIRAVPSTGSIRTVESVGSMMEA
eukprot:TRINITY_DN4219_c0_g1_i1.p1 TRINITY_DN4219_c0_g1~~TRINITY_DN4219_c0_g1_i1.p1  ORF type:complete len:188 (+),score=44.70 TRINITY_DN4219_c0_g1_i1:77-640(+)